ncbi:MAG: type III polyketide synthase [Trueperaceae bacterium]|nr:type III polyketide synthase [Trueperaceae bacterium]
MSVRIEATGTALPAHAYERAEVLDVMRRWVGGERRTDRLLERVYAASGIDRRWSVLDDLRPARCGTLYLDDAGAFRSPGTGERNDRYIAEAPPLAERAARVALGRLPGFEADAITQLITVSCTGFHAPGTDDHLVRALGLSPSTERYHLGFMGCYAAFPALRMANAFCRADPDAVVLIVCVELCTLHLAPTREVDSILSTSVFADGAAAAVVSARDLRGEQLPLELLATSSALTVDGRQDMAWTIGDHGFDMVLTSYVPRVLEAEIATALAPLLERAGVTQDEVARWAVHPGGRAILDKVAIGLGLDRCALAASRDVLADAGNMSSATVLFVLERLTTSPGQGGAWSSDRRAEVGELIASFAFGPGLTVDSAIFKVG